MLSLLLLFEFGRRARVRGLHGRLGGANEVPAFPVVGRPAPAAHAQESADQSLQQVLGGREDVRKGSSVCK